MADADEKNWEKTRLQEPLDYLTLRTTCDGSVYEVNEKEGFIYDVSDKSRFDYKGELIEILDDYVVSKDGGRLRLEVISKDK